MAKMNNFFVRTLSGAVFAAVVIALTIFSQFGLLALVLFIGCVGVYEFLKLQKSLDFIKVLFAISIHILVVAATFWYDSYLSILIFGIGTLSMVFLLVGLWKYGTKIYENIGPVFFALIYISLPLALFQSYSLQEDPYDFRRPLMVFLLVWSSDTFAYLTGRSIGKTALSRELSPKKTWEGFVGGTILTGILGGVLAYFWQFSSVTAGVILGILVSIFGTAGDLFQSALKRTAGVKDSGNIIPGHGGILDRFDAFLFVCVVVYMFNLVIGII